MLSEEMFNLRDGGVFLNKKGKQHFIPLFHQFMGERCEFRGSIATRRNHLYRFAGYLREQIAAVAL